jgi:hypothetical protein
MCGAEKDAAQTAAAAREFNSQPTRTESSPPAYTRPRTNNNDVLCICNSYRMGLIAN